MIEKIKANVTKLSVLFALSLMISATAYAESGAIECTGGNPAGWRVWYEKAALQPVDGDIITVHFENETGITAFKILATVNFYNIFDEYLGRAEWKQDGPIHKYFVPNIKVPHGTSKMTCDIYWKDKYE